MLSKGLSHIIAENRVGDTLAVSCLKWDFNMFLWRQMDILDISQQRWTAVFITHVWIGIMPFDFLCFYLLRATRPQSVTRFGKDGMVKIHTSTCPMVNDSSNPVQWRIYFEHLVLLARATAWTRQLCFPEALNICPDCGTKLACPKLTSLVIYKYTNRWWEGGGHHHHVSQETAH